MIKPSPRGCESAARPSTLLTPDACRQARLSLGWSPERLAIVAGLAPQTIVQFEREGCSPRPGTVIALRKALKSAGVLAAPDQG